jgi:hypothetical protein
MIGLVKNKLERKLKKAGMAPLRRYSGISLGSLTKTIRHFSQDIVSEPRLETVTSEIRNRSANYMTAKYGSNL